MYLYLYNFDSFCDFVSTLPNIIIKLTYGDPFLVRQDLIFMLGNWL
jgi:hypothetical protein